MAVGEEMITGLDGWASPPDLLELSPGAGSGFLSPAVDEGEGFVRGVGSWTPLMASVHVTPAHSRPSSPPPY